MNDTDTITRLVISIDPKEPEPRTLAEIHAEVGFPFSARKVKSTSRHEKNLPVGTELTFVDADKQYPEFYCVAPINSHITDSTVKAWILLGHK